MTTTASTTTQITEMSNKLAFTSDREAFLAITEVTQDNFCRFCLKLMYAIKEETISTFKADHIIQMFTEHCKENNIDTLIPY